MGLAGKDMPDKMYCIHCGDVVSVGKFSCGCSLIDECYECHMELSHGEVRDISLNKPVCGNLKPMTEDDMQYYPRLCDRFYR